MTESENENDLFDLDHFDHFFCGGGVRTRSNKEAGVAIRDASFRLPQVCLRTKKAPTARSDEG